VGLADDIRALRARTTAELIAAHDYYTDTRRAWDFLAGDIAPRHHGLPMAFAARS
jgi:hypothetical protein